MKINERNSEIGGKVRVTLNFTPDPFLQERIKAAAKGDREALLGLCMEDISYDEEREIWVKLPEALLDWRRSCKHDPDAYLRHEARRWDLPSQYSLYGSWYSSFLQELDASDFTSRPHSHLSPYAFAMELFDAGFNPQEAAEMFARADAERHARQMEAMEVGA